MIKIKKFVFNEFSVNSFVAWDESRECLIIDPGCIDEIQCSELKNFIADESLKPVYIVNTHGHVDHIAGNDFARNEFQCPVLMHKADLFLLRNAVEIAAMFGFQMDKPSDPDRFILENEKITFGTSTFLTLFVPGHSPGSVCLYSEPDKLAICGDVLFYGSIGRTDLHGGNYDMLISNIREKLMVLPHDTVVYPGHGPETTLAQEKRMNPFLR